LILSFSQKRLEPKLAEVALDEAIIVLDLRRSQGQRNGFDTAHPKRKNAAPLGRRFLIEGLEIRNQDLRISF
jgi:hypothetical protein